MYEEVLKFWFEEIDPSFWFKKDESFDEEIRSRFGELHSKAVNGELEDWKQTTEGMLAYIVLIDQFSRNMFRDTPESFAYDHIALTATKEAIDKGFDEQAGGRIAFVYMPLMHSENLEDQNLCVDLFEELAENDEKFRVNYDYAIQHRDIIERFGRFPHRNAVLGRESTPEEVEFLEKPGSSF